MNLVFDIVLWCILFAVVGIFLSSGLRITAGFYILMAFFITITIVMIWMPTWKPSPLSFIPVGIISLTGILYDIIILSTEPAYKRYFGALNWVFGVMVCYFFILVPLFRRELHPSLIWSPALLLVVVFGWLCRRARENHEKVFLITGSLLFCIFMAEFLIHPLSQGAALSINNIVLSLKLNAMFLVPLGLFFFGNYAKLGMLDDQKIHIKIVGVFIGLLIISWVARTPQLESVLDNIPFGDKIPGVSGAAALIYLPAIVVIKAQWRGKA